MKKSLLLLAVLMLATQANAINLCFFGDSITLGYLSSPPVKPGTLVAGELNAFTGTNLYTSTTYALIGTTTQQWYPGGGNAIASAISAFNAAGGCAAVFGMLGTNDAADNIHTDPVSYNARMTAIVGALEAAGCNTILLDFSPYDNAQNNANHNPATTNPRLIAYQQQLIAVAQADPTHVFVGDRQAFSYFQSNLQLYSPDGIHPSGGPNNAGYMGLATLWVNAYVRLALGAFGTAGAPPAVR